MMSKPDQGNGVQTFGKPEVKFPWVTYWRNDERGLRVDLQLTWPALHEILNNVPSDNLRTNSLPFLAN